MPLQEPLHCLSFLSPQSIGAPYRRQPPIHGPLPSFKRQSVKPPVEEPTSMSLKPGNVNSEFIKKSLKLNSGAANKGKVLGYRVTADALFLTSEPALLTTRPSTMTRPAIIRAWAFVLVFTSPRSTRSLSIRDLVFCFIYSQKSSMAALFYAEPRQDRAQPLSSACVPCSTNESGTPKPLDYQRGLL